MKLIVRADDFGITDGVTWGALRALQEGIATSSGVMTNMPSSERACLQAKMYSELCFGQDINIATGQCVAPKKLLPTMVDENGYFRRSHLIRKMIQNNKEPFPYDEVKIEIKAQLDKFITLVGRKPEYLNGHAFRSPHFTKALHDVANEYHIICMDDLVQEYDLENQGFSGNAQFSSGWYHVPFEWQSQIETNAKQYFIDHFDELLDKKVAYIICHPGYVDKDLMKCSSLNLVRMNDLEMCLSQEIKDLLQKNSVELISITEFYQMMKEQ